MNSMNVKMNNTKLEKLIKENLNDFPLGDEFEQRSVGDKIENACKQIVKKHFPNNYKDPRSKKSTEDFTIFENKSNVIHEYYADVKTHEIKEKEGLSMPNLVSVDKLFYLLNDETKTLSYIFVDYMRSGGKLKIQDVTVKYIWDLDWSILTIAGIGLGQLQIKNANKELKFTNIGKKSWQDILKNEVPLFYDKQIIKLDKLKEKWQ